MSNGPWKFNPRHVTQAVKALARAGYFESRVEIDPATRKIVVIGHKLRETAEPTAEVTGANEWDAALKA
jgi:hypothetical protein